ncbi:MAG: response regulator [Bacteroidota bacterium]
MSKSAHLNMTSAQKKLLFQEITDRSDRIFRLFLPLSFLAGLGLAVVYDTWLIALLVGGLSLVAYFLTKQLLPESNLYQYVGSAVLAIFMAQFIFQMHGLFEMHFFAFVGCTILITYANWRLQVPLLVLVVIHHGVFAYLQFIGVDGVFFTQLPYMDLSTFLFHVVLAGLIIFICGLWGYYMEKQVIQDGLRALEAERTLQTNLLLAQRIKEGKFEEEEELSGGPLSEALIDMRNHIRQSQEKEEAEKYINLGVSQVTGLLAEIDQEDIIQMSRTLLTAVAKYIGANQASFFLYEDQLEEEPFLQMISGYAFQKRKGLQHRISLGEGLVGQCALERHPISIEQLPEDFLRITSSLGEAIPTEVLAWPLLVDQQLLGVMEFATFGHLTASQEAFLTEIAPRIAHAIAISQAQKKTQDLLSASEELKQELQESNQQLGAQTEALLASEKDLKAQQTRLLEANTELEKQATELEERHQAIEQARSALALKAEELKASNAYKSEFLANMSHELRTPLNSILILANMLSENQHGSLKPKEVEHAEVIYKAGSDLLTLINDILDLSKIESGKLDVLMEEVGLEEIHNDMEMIFREVAEQKQVDFSIEIKEGSPTYLTSDRIRLEQILKNFLSNAIKFTPPQGSVKLRIGAPEPLISFQHEGLRQASGVLAFSVEDTGIGIPPEKQALIFEAFQQADGSTSRQYGGTGLGLSISVTLASLLGGEIRLESEEGTGSCFTLFLPTEHVLTPHTAKPKVPAKASPNIAQNFSSIEGKEVLLVEDSPHESEAISKYLGEQGLIIHQAFEGQAGLNMLTDEPQIACILLDMRLPDMSGLEFLETLKSQEEFSSLPVIVHTAMELNQETQLRIMQHTASMVLKASSSHERLLGEIAGLLSQTTAPAAAPSQEISSSKEPLIISAPPTASLENIRVLLVDDDMRNVYALSSLLSPLGAVVESAMDGKEALSMLNGGFFPDCILLDIMMPGMDGFACLQQIRSQEAHAGIPVFIMTAKSREGDQEKSKELGAQAFLPKPLDTALLLEHILSFKPKPVA